MHGNPQPKTNSLEREIIEALDGKTSKCPDCELYCRDNGLPKHGPLTFFNVGEKFGNDRYSIVFVGKNTWYNTQDVCELDFFPDSKVFRDCRAQGAYMFKNDSRAFWSYTKEITKRIYPEFKEDLDSVLDRIVITNLTCCNTSEGPDDTTPFHLTDNCFAMFAKEIQILQRGGAKHVVFYTGFDYDSYILKLTGPNGQLSNVTDIDHKKRIGNLEVCWWETEFSNNANSNSMSILRTRHPQRAPKEELIKEIIDWIKK
jgi:hypothetical protein